MRYHVKLTTRDGHVRYGCMVASTGRVMSWTRDVTRALALDSARAGLVSHFYAVSIAVGETITLEEVAPAKIET